METRSNQILVGAVMLGLVVAVIVFLIWLSQIGEGDRKSYDIFFQQSVEGLNKGSQVTYSGVPVGQVDTIELDPRNPQFVRVRITVRDTTPVLAASRLPNGERANDGTTATVASPGFTGVAQVQLTLPDTERARGQRQALTCPDEGSSPLCPYGVPVIPPRPGGFAAILNSAPELLERVTSLTERLTAVFSDRNQQSIAQILENVDNLTKSLGDRGPEIAATLAEARTTMRQAGDAVEQMGRLAGSTDRLINREGPALTRELRTSLQAATGSLAALEQSIGAAQPGIETFSQRTLPEVGALVRDLRATSESLRNISERLERQGVGSLLGSERLPDYQPGRR
jgi:phospholipid/cholesterol/gamma-HCH transport system substrate-binding protein